jgi:hypothetical protein
MDLTGSLLNLALILAMLASVLVVLLYPCTGTLSVNPLLLNFLN